MNRKNAFKLVILFLIISVLFLIGDMVYSSILTCNKSLWKLGECNESSEAEGLEYEPMLDVLMQNNT